MTKRVSPHPITQHIRYELVPSSFAWPVRVRTQTGDIASYGRNVVYAGNVMRNA